MEWMEEVFFPAIGILFLLFGIVLLMQMLFSSFNPYDQIAFANTEKLRAAINEACATNDGRGVALNSFELRQSVPVGSWFFSILPRWMIRNSGDPNYVLYYESYPPYDAVGWEVYHPFQTRLIAPVTEEYLQTANHGSNSVSMYAENIYKEYKNQKPGDIVEMVLVNNVILNPNFRTDFMLTQSGTNKELSEFPAYGGSRGRSSSQAGTRTDKALDDFVGYGDWKDPDPGNPQVPREGDNQFKFNNYASLSLLEKTAIKYQPCGAQSLCLKTRGQVYRFPLDQCGDIKNVELIYDARAKVENKVASLVGIGAAGAGISWLGAVGTVGEGTSSIIGSLARFSRKHPILALGGIIGAENTAVGFLKRGVGYFISFKTSDLSIASPCLLKSSGTDADSQIVVRKDRCDLYDKDGILDDDYSPCTRVVKYPLYEYNPKTGNLDPVRIPDGDNDPTNDPIRYHYTCAEKLDYEYPDEPAKSGYEPGDACIQIFVPTQAEGFCWTSDPWKDEPWYGSDTQLIITVMGFNPIEEAIGYMAPTGNLAATFVQKAVSDNGLGDIHDRFERIITWGWPGGLGA